MNKRIVHIGILLITAIVVFSISRCRSLEVEREMKITMDTINSIASRSALALATIEDVGSGINSYGHCWSESQNPTLNDSSTNFGVAQKPIPFESNLKDLEPNKTYYIRAYVNDGDKIIYSKERKFKTLDLGITNIKTGDVEIVDSTKITISGEISAFGEGVDTIYEYGHCWATHQEPTIEDFRTNFGKKTDVGFFRSELSSLELNKTYYFKSYVIDQKGIVYGEQVEYINSGTLPVFYSFKIDSISSGSIYFSGDFSNPKAFTLVSLGVCISQTPNPTKDSTNIVLDNQDGHFRGHFTGLSRVTDYYLRAWASNIMGDRYSHEIQINTLADFPILQTKEVTVGTYTYAVSGGILIDDGGSEILELGVCWSTNSLPSINDNRTYDVLNNAEFTSTIKGFATETTYYVMAYAKNSRGVGYGNSLVFTTPKDADTIIDSRNGKSYFIRYYCSMENFWLAENLNLNVDGSFFYDNNVLNSQLYGRLYSYEAAMTQTNPLLNIHVNQGVCGGGMHIPSEAEWTSRIIDCYYDPGNMHKDNIDGLWVDDNSATNLSGFKALPGGIATITDSSTIFEGEGHEAWFWTSEGTGVRFIENSGEVIISPVDGKKAMSVRCISNTIE